MVLTISGHADCNALLESAVLTSVPVDAENRTLLVLGARSVLDLLLDASTEEPLLNGREKDLLISFNSV